MQTSNSTNIEHLLEEIRGHFGFIPPFFAPVQSTPPLLENLWQQTRAVYIDNPLPAEFKEKLFMYLSHSCHIPYDLHCHCIVLHSLGVMGREIYALLQTPPPTVREIEECLAQLRTQQDPLETWPELDTTLEDQLFSCSTHLFLKPKRAEPCRRELRRLLGAQYAYLTALLSYMRTCHHWVETHTDILLENDEHIQQHFDILFGEETYLKDVLLTHRKKAKQERQKAEEQLRAEIDEHKQLEAALQQSTQQAEARTDQLEAIFEAMGDAVFVHDSKGRIIEANAAARKLFPYDPSPHVTRPLYERGIEFAFRDEQGQALPLEQWPTSRILNGEMLTGARTVDVVFQTADGRDLQLNVSGVPMHDDTDALTGAVTIYRDVTERRQLERRTDKALNALLAVAELLVLGHDESSEDDTAWVASSTVKRLLELTQSVLGCERIGIMSVDPATERMQPVVLVGFSRELEQLWWASVPGSRLIDQFLDPTLISRLQKGEVLELDKGRPPFNAQPDSNGIRTWIVAPMRIGKQLVGLLSLDYGDVEHDYTTDEKKFALAIARLIALVLERDHLLLERAESQAREIALQESHQRMNEFLSIASHELKTPITSIKGNIQVLLRRLRREHISLKEHAQMSEEVQELLVRADHQVNRLTRLVSDLIDVSRIQAKRLELRLDLSDLVVLVREVVYQQRRAAPQRTINLELLTEEVPVLIDPDRIEQVLTNYLSNALKYSDVEQPITVSLRAEGQMVRVSVRDEGPGLSPADQEHIWERFYRAQESSVRSGSTIGLGLGLYICRSIIEQHGGQVGIESTPGAGSTFWFTLQLFNSNL